MKIKIVWWYPSKLQKDVAEEYNGSLEDCISYLVRYCGLFVCIPKDFFENYILYVDETFFRTR